MAQMKKFIWKNENGRIGDEMNVIPYFHIKWKIIGWKSNGMRWKMTMSDGVLGCGCDNDQW